MASTAWRTRLNRHPIFAKLKANPSKLAASVEARNIIAVQEGLLFVWDAEHQCIYVVNLRNVEPSYQILTPSTIPRSDVQGLVLNASGRRLALVGRQSITVAELPRRLAPPPADLLQEKHFCKSIAVAERVLVGRTRVEVLQASWHPGSKDDCHVVVLTSDNVLRIYKTTESQDPQQQHLLGASAAAATYGSTGRTFLGCLGDTAVAFDFGPKLEPTKADQPALWPIFVLRGNGDVYSILTSLETPRALFPLRGPLTMHPPAEDNYGVDACSILCIPSTPPVLVVATSSGTLHHCLVVNRRSSQAHEDTDEDADNGRNGNHSDLALYVLESVELELALSTLSLDTGDLDEVPYISCPIRLLADPSCPMRYHCCHAAGVHTVALPVIPHLDRFLERDDDDGTSLIQPEQAAIVEHLICTRPLQNSPPSPVLGVTVYEDRALGSLLLCLTCDMEMITLRLAAFYHDQAPGLLSIEDEESEMSSPRAPRTPSFDSHIQKIIQRTTSNPIIKSSPSSDLSPQEGLQLLGRVTQVLRIEYIQRLELANQEIQRRVKALQDVKTRQIEELEEMELLKGQLTAKAQHLAERYEDACDKQIQITSRVDAVLQNIQQSLPVVSDAERGMHRELQGMEEKLQQLESSMNQVKMKQKYQQRQLLSQRDQHIAKTETASLSDSRKKQLQEILQEQSLDLAALMRRVSVFMQELGI